MSVIALPTTVLAGFVNPSLWPWTCVMGALGVALCNWLTLVLSDRILTAAEGHLSTIPPAGQRVARGYEQWWWTMLLYAFIIMIVGIGLQLDVLQDVWAYVFILVVITVGIHYASKCVVAGLTVRGGIARAFSAGERIAVLRERGAGEVGGQAWPPRMRGGRTAQANGLNPRPGAVTHDP
jgi:hypothetical protein